jgi:hypothetical protein
VSRQQLSSFHYLQFSFFTLAIQHFFLSIVLQPNAHNGFLIHTKRLTTFSRTLLDEWTARRRDLYLTTHNTHNKHSCARWDLNPQTQQAICRRHTP